MKKLARTDLMSLEDYADKRTDFRKKVIAHKQHRSISLGEHLRIYFEDRLTIQYQIQEMLRIEKVFEASGIQEELEAYNPLIPDGCNLKATLMVEYEDVDEDEGDIEDGEVEEDDDEEYEETVEVEYVDDDEEEKN